MNFEEEILGKPLFRVNSYNKVLFRPRAMANHLEGIQMVKMSCTALINLFLFYIDFVDNPKAGKGGPRFFLKM